MIKDLVLEKRYIEYSQNWLSAVKFAETRRKSALRPSNGSLYHYAGNNPVKYTDPDGKELLPFNIKDFLNLTNDPFNSIHNEMLASDIGDKNAQARLKYVFHEAGRETLKQASSTLNDMSIVSLCVGFPEGTAVFGNAAAACDLALAIDDFVTDLRNSETRGDYLNSAKNFGTKGGLIIAGFAYGEVTKKGSEAISKAINVKIGSSGRFYELGHRGAIRSREGFRKLLMKDIASGYFGQEAIPNAPLIMQEAMKVYDAVKGSGNEK